MLRALDFGGGYVRRVVDQELDELLPHLPAVLLDGPKGVGKTATAVRRARTVRQLDVAGQRAIVEADPGVAGGDEAPVLLDEWQRVPEVFDAVRRLVDDDPTGGRFLLTGSAPTRATHSGAGRITSLRMRPLTLAERLERTEGVSLRRLLDGSARIGGRCDLTLADYAAEITAGGFPGMRRLRGRALQRQLDGYLERIVDHDLSEAGLTVRRPATVMAWLRANAAAVATTTSWEKIRNAAVGGAGEPPARTTTMPYIELLTALRILDPLPAWSPSHNHLGGLVGAPKHHLADPALAARLLRSSASTLLTGRQPVTGRQAGVAVARDGTYLGALFESLTALSVRTFAQNADARTYHLRDGGGRHEVDFVVEAADGRVLGVEAKLSAAVTDTDVAHLLWFRERLGDDCVGLVVVTTGPEAYRRPDGVAVVPLGLLQP